MDRFEQDEMNHISRNISKRIEKPKEDSKTIPPSSILLSNLTNSRVFPAKNKPNEGRIREETNKNTLDKNSLDTTPPQQRQRRINSKGGSHERMEKLKNLQTT